MVKNLRTEPAVEINMTPSTAHPDFMYKVLMRSPGNKCDVTSVRPVGQVEWPLIGPQTQPY